MHFHIHSGKRNLPICQVFFVCDLTHIILKRNYQMRKSIFVRNFVQLDMRVNGKYGSYPCPKQSLTICHRTQFFIKKKRRSIQKTSVNRGTESSLACWLANAMVNNQRLSPFHFFIPTTSLFHLMHELPIDVQACRVLPLQPG